MQELKFVKREDKRSDQTGAAACSCSPKDAHAEPQEEDARSLAERMLCCPGAATPAWITGVLPSPAGPVPQAAADWSRSDYLGMVRSRIGAFRMRYAVPPGLYAVGSPDRGSDVLVSANYKLSFDVLRRAVKGMNVWVLVLDTKGINVWCAGGKGTFGTEELVKRMAGVRLAEVVNHRRLIVPQLGAAGVSAHAVQKQTGFRVSFGPVSAKDIPAYVREGRRKTAAMSTVRFTMLDRLVLTPMEINPAMKKFPWFALGALLLFGLEPTGILYRNAWTGGVPILVLLLVSVLAGAFLTPVLLPFVPFRSFAVKGWIVGVITTAAAVEGFGLIHAADRLLLAAAYLFFPAVSSYLALQFTGATTYTGISGVKKELRFGIPVYAGAVVLSAVLLVLFKLGEWRVL